MIALLIVAVAVSLVWALIAAALGVAWRDYHGTRR